MFENVYDVFTYWKQWWVVQQFPKDTTNGPKYKAEKKPVEIKEYSAPSVFLINACNFFIKQPVSKLFELLHVHSCKVNKYISSYFFTIVNSLSNMDLRLLMNSESTCRSLSHILHPFASSTQNALPTFYPKCSNLNSHPWSEFYLIYIDIFTYLPEIHSFVILPGTIQQLRSSIPSTNTDTHVL